MLVIIYMYMSLVEYKNMTLLYTYSPNLTNICVYFMSKFMVTHWFYLTCTSSEVLNVPRQITPSEGCGQCLVETWLSVDLDSAIVVELPSGLENINNNSWNAIVEQSVQQLQIKFVKPYF